MMANRNLLAPKPQGSTLIQQSSARTGQLLEALEALGEQDVEIIATTQLSPKQASKLRRQSRNRAYQKDRKDFYEGTATPTQQRESTSPSTDISRGPSRYLMALLKFEPERKSVIEMMFSDDDSVDLELSLDVVLAPLIQLASPGKKRYAYKTAEPTPDNHCPDCAKNLSTLVTLLYISSSIVNFC